MTLPIGDVEFNSSETRPRPPTDQNSMLNNFAVSAISVAICTIYVISNFAGFIMTATNVTTVLN